MTMDPKVALLLASAVGGGALLGWLVYKGAQFVLSRFLGPKPSALLAAGATGVVALVSGGYLLTAVVVGLFWKFMLDVQFGVVNSFLDSLGLGRAEWLTQQQLALFSLIVVDTWQWTPFIMLIALAGLTAVPKYLYEAAEIDRASEWFKFRRITLPLVWPLLLIAVMFRAIEAFRLFDLVYILTGGGPGGTTETLSYNVYKVAFFGFDTGRAAAYGILMVIVVIIASQLYLRYLHRLQAR